MKIGFEHDHVKDKGKVVLTTDNSWCLSHPFIFKLLLCILWPVLVGSLVILCAVVVVVFSLLVVVVPFLPVRKAAEKDNE